MMVRAKRESSKSGKATVAGKSGGIKKVVFSVVAPEAECVAVAGTFNDWNTEKHLLQRGKKGVWTTAITLMPGRYEFKFIIDGEWVIDQSSEQKSDNPFGTQNSVLHV